LLKIDSRKISHSGTEALRRKEKRKEKKEKREEKNITQRHNGTAEVKELLFEG